MATEKEGKQGEAKGFAGLSSLVSDVDTTPPPTDKKEPTNAAPSIGPASTQPAQPQPRPSQHQAYVEPTRPPAGSSGIKWVLGIGALIGVVWLIGQSNSPPTRPAPAYTPAPAYVPPPQSFAPSPTPPSRPQPQPQSRPQESLPPVGQNLVLSKEQISYCIAEEIRIDGARSALNNSINRDVDRFNTMVDDFNSRCGSFRYRSGTLDSVRREMEPYQSLLRLEGRNRFPRNPSFESSSVPAPPARIPVPTADRVPDPTVQAIQRRLNELGYDSGTADGLMGNRTRSAIIAFQQENGLVVTGLADLTLLTHLQRTPARRR